MGRTGIRPEYEDIMEAAGRAEQLPRIEVTRQVMGRIAALEAGRTRRGPRLMGKTAAAAGMLTMLLLVTVTAYAATEYIQIRNSAGKVKVQHVQDDTGWPKIGPDNPENSSGNPYEWKVQSLAKPGELMAYYVRGTEPSTPESALQFSYKEQRLTDYSAFIKEMKRTGAPLLPQQAGGYAFKYGGVYANHPGTAELESDPVYRQALSELVGEARTDKTRNLFVKAVPWSKAAGVNATYTKGGAVVGILATPLNGANIQVGQKAETTAEIIEVEGREVVYNHTVRPEVSYHYLNWYNEKQDHYYTVSTYGDRELSKEQLLQLAGELIRGGL
ncbi:hypothetical protein [Paenibacillus tepidiphilus]|uniref:hypothetical protein n=1 Tax=Paenibacillus tepidiphilus TaxID=2608683 RepID=UPI001239D455|nr:hypothetical protein [Paenibacillus tepidiphilus]